MNTAKFLGNCNHIIDWNNIIQDLSTQVASTIGPILGEGYKDEYIPESIPNPKKFFETKKIWTESGYKSSAHGGSAEWHMFYPGINFDRSVVDKFIEFYKIDNFHQCWISMILPGKCAPWHVDQYNQDENTKRYHCHIGPLETGHVFMIDEEYYINSSQGDTYVWNDIYSWHAGFNAGRNPKFLLNLH
jgi:hypothetical protein